MHGEQFGVIGLNAALLTLIPRPPPQLLRSHSLLLVAGKDLICIPRLHRGRKVCARGWVQNYIASFYLVLLTPLSSLFQQTYQSKGGSGVDS